MLNSSGKAPLANTGELPKSTRPKKARCPREGLRHLVSWLICFGFRSAPSRAADAAHPVRRLRRRPAKYNRSERPATAGHWPEGAAAQPLLLLLAGLVTV